MSFHTSFGHGPTVHTPFVLGSIWNYILKWFFFVHSILADRYIHRREMWVVSLKSCSSVEFKTKKIFLNFVFFFEELSTIEVLCEHGIFGMILFISSVIFLQIKILSKKIIFQINISCHKLNQLCVPNRLKAIKKTSSCLIGKFTIKQNRILFDSSFLENLSFF